MTLGGGWLPSSVSPSLVSVMLGMSRLLETGRRFVMSTTDSGSGLNFVGGRMWTSFFKLLTILPCGEEDPLNLKGSRVASLGDTTSWNSWTEPVSNMLGDAKEDSWGLWFSPTVVNSGWLGGIAIIGDDDWIDSTAFESDLSSWNLGSKNVSTGTDGSSTYTVSIFQAQDNDTSPRTKTREILFQKLRLDPPLIPFCYKKNTKMKFLNNHMKIKKSPYFLHFKCSKTPPFLLTERGHNFCQLNWTRPSAKNMEMSLRPYSNCN